MHGCWVFARRMFGRFQRRTRRLIAPRILFLMVGLVAAATLGVIYLITGWVKFFGPEANYDSYRPFVQVDPPGMAAPEGGWEFTLLGYPRFAVQRIPARTLLTKLLSNWCSGAGSAQSLSDRVVMIFRSWASHETEFLQDLGVEPVRIQLTQDRLRYQPGDRIRLRGLIRLPREWARLARSYGWQPCLAFAGDRIFDSQGIYHMPIGEGMGTFLTPTGSPIEMSFFSMRNSKIGSPMKSPIEGVVNLGLQSPHPSLRENYEIDISVEVPADCPPGHYRLAFEVGAFDRGRWIKAESWTDYDRAQHGQYTSFVDMIRNHRWVLHGPMFSVGSSSDSLRLYWTYLNDVYSSGSRGAFPEEDERRFALNLTGIYQNRVVLAPFDKDGKPIVYDLSPFFPTQELAYNQEPSVDSTIDFVNEYYPPLPLSPRGGHWALTVRGPQDVVVRKDEGTFDEVNNYRALSDRLKITFPRFGKYTIELKGTVSDVYGNRYDGGGRFQVYAALPLSYSSSTKPAQSYALGTSINPRLHIFPPGKTNVRFIVTLFRNSNENDTTAYEREDESNQFGYFYPRKWVIPPFESAGEYRADIEFWRWEGREVLRYGHIYQAGIVYDPRTVSELKHFDLFPTETSCNESGQHDCSYISKTMRLLAGDPNSSFSQVFLPDNQEELTVASSPEWNPTIVYTTFGWAKPETAGMSPPPWKQSVRVSDKNCATGTCYWDSLPGRGDRRLNAHWYFDYGDGEIYYNSAFPAPIVSYSDVGYNAAMFPERTQVKSYCYFSAYRPGLPLRRLVADATNLENYWFLSPARDAKQLNARLQGDTENDHYRITAGCVRKEYDTGKTYYGYYASGLAISSSHSNLNGHFIQRRVPVATVGGEQIYRLFGSSPEPGSIFSAGDKIAVGGFVLPTKADLPVHFQFEFPGGRIEKREGETNRYGEFSFSPVEAGDRAGMLWVQAKSVDRDGIETRILGAPENRVLTFIAARRHGKIALNLSPGDTFDPNMRIHIIARAPEGLVDGRAGYVRVTPGMILDQGTRLVREDGVFGISFSLAQDSVRSGFFRSRSSMESYDGPGSPPEAPDGNTQSMILFVSGHDRSGAPFTADAFVLMKGNRVLTVDGSGDSRGDNFSTWPVYPGRPTVPETDERAGRVGSIDDCTHCHGEGDLRGWKSAPYERSEWKAVLNWHRARSEGLFWPPQEDEQQILSGFSLPPQDAERTKEDRTLIKAWCNQCHPGWRRMIEKNLRYTREGWQRYVDYRFPPDRSAPIPAEKHAWARRLIPEQCVLCHTTSIMQATPSIHLLDSEGRVELVAALARQLVGEAVLPFRRSGTDSVGRKAYQRICYSCHSLELARTKHTPLLAEFAPRHLAEKAAGSLDQNEREELLKFLSQ